MAEPTRRGFLRGLIALPFAPVLAKYMPEAPAVVLERFKRDPSAWLDLDAPRQRGAYTALAEALKRIYPAEVFAYQARLTSSLARLMAYEPDPVVEALDQRDLSERMPQASPLKVKRWNRHDCARDERTRVHRRARFAQDDVFAWSDPRLAHENVEPFAWAEEGEEEAAQHFFPLALAP